MGWLQSLLLENILKVWGKSVYSLETATIPFMPRRFRLVFFWWLTIDFWTYSNGNMPDEMLAQEDCHCMWKHANGQVKNYFHTTKAYRILLTVIMPFCTLYLCCLLIWLESKGYDILFMIWKKWGHECQRPLFITIDAFKNNVYGLWNKSSWQWS